MSAGVLPGDLSGRKAEAGESDGRGGGRRAGGARRLTLFRSLPENKNRVQSNCTVKTASLETRIFK